ncbi:MAG: cohesin domain-containing protein, partial [Anaerovoracaceae bacterium]
MKQKIKRIWTILLCMAVILTTMPGGAVTGYAEEAAGPSVTVTSTTARAGNYAYLYVDAADFPSLLGLEFTIYYDDTAMTLSSCSAGSLLSGSVTDINKSTAGVIKVAAMNENEISGSG